MHSSPSVIVNWMELDLITWRSDVGWFAAVFYDPTADRCPCAHHRSKYGCDEFLYVPLMSFPGHVLVIFAASWRWRSWSSVLLWMHLLQPLLLLWWLCLVVPGTAWHCMPAACLVQPSYTHTPPVTGDPCQARQYSMELHRGWSSQIYHIKTKVIVPSPTFSLQQQGCWCLPYTNGYHYLQPTSQHLWLQKTTAILQ